MKRVMTFGFAAVLTMSALLVASSAFARRPPPPPPPPKSCNCPDVYAPVICSNGVIYSNLCQAGCAGATGCVPHGDSTAARGGCICPKIYAPVICDNGKTYSNQCLADCRNADNCTPTGEI